MHRSSAAIWATVATLLAGCSEKFVKEKQLDALNQDLIGVYKANTDIDIGNGKSLPKGDIVCLYASSTEKDSVKLYAYPYREVREEVLPSNVLYMFKEDFEGKKFDQQVFEKNISERFSRVEGEDGYCQK